MSKTGRGVIYIVWGDEIEPMLQRSIASLKRYHPELPVEVIRIPAANPASLENLREKASMFDRTPFAETLFLDADTVVFDNLDFGFAKARQFRLACCISEAPWARRFRGLAGRGDIVEYNTGVLFFTEKAKPIFDQWRVLIPQIDASEMSGYQGKLMVRPFNDQASFAAAIEVARVSPFVLPINWNYRYPGPKIFFGPLNLSDLFAAR